jgi:hypothetical protein
MAEKQKRIVQMCTCERKKARASVAIRLTVYDNLLLRELFYTYKTALIHSWVQNSRNSTVFQRKTDNDRKMGKKI